VGSDGELRLVPGPDVERVADAVLGVRVVAREGEHVQRESSGSDERRLSPKP
jgi:hypothetical protein